MRFIGAAFGQRLPCGAAAGGGCVDGPAPRASAANRRSVTSSRTPSPVFFQLVAKERRVDIALVSLHHRVHLERVRGSVVDRSRGHDFDVMRAATLVGVESASVPMRSGLTPRATRPRGHSGVARAVADGSRSSAALSEPRPCC